MRRPRPGGSSTTCSRPSSRRSPTNSPNCGTCSASTPEVQAWLSKNPHVHFHFTPVGSSWLNQVEIWFGILTRQSIRRGTFSSVNVLIKQIRDYIDSWNENAKSFTWTATAGEVLAKVRLVQTNMKKLVRNNS
ncbi:hypothetical protein ABZW18_00215 [Streptomyces sp. NPDC004647]|uniref:hypothetical protein n=1 Tax=Streptomyces sp. NPDC004647 TaxID=3154671 RepID=UPI0033B59C93